MSTTTKIDIEHGSCRNADNLLAELDRQLAEDDVNPNDMSVGKLFEPRLKLDGAVWDRPIIPHSKI